MAPTPATITVNFISNYAGPHRVCWRIGGVGPYDCTTIVVCTGGGAACSAIIPITVDNETCDPVDFDGYVQATCEVIGSLNGRVPFAAIFTPVPPCRKWDVTCNAVDIPSYNVLTPGSGYTVGSTPALSIIGGGGSGAVATGVVGDGGIKTETITNGGAGYNGGGSAVFLNVAAQNITGTGAGALFDVTVTAGVITALALSVSILSPGTGYAVTDTFDFNNAFLGGSGAGAIITVATLNTGEIQYILVTNSGSGYSSTPATTIAAPPAGVTATVSPNMGDCPQFDFGLDCDGNAIGFVTPKPLGFAYKKCAAIAPTPPAEWIVAEVGCCYDCRTVTFTAIPGPNINVGYTDCTTGELIVVVVNPASAPVVVCAVNNSWFWTPTASVNATVGIVCP